LSTTFFTKDVEEDTHCLCVGLHFLLFHFLYILLRWKKEQTKRSEWVDEWSQQYEREQNSDLSLWTSFLELHVEEHSKL
jgi:hypothetical protein